MVVLIDYAGFNLYLAQAARKLDIPVVYYICPQLWAHGAWRVKKLKRLVSKVLVIYPFEEGFYTRAGIPVRYVGHPLFDELAKRELDKELIEKHLLRAYRAPTAYPYYGEEVRSGRRDRSRFPGRDY